MIKQLALLLLLASIAAASAARQSFNAVVDKVITDGVKTIKKSMDLALEDSLGLDVIQEVRLQAREQLTKLLAQQTGRKHYQIYSSFAGQLSSAREAYYDKKFGTLFLMYPVAQIWRDKDVVTSNALDAYGLLIWAASMKRPSDNVLLEVVKLLCKFVEEMAEFKWKSGSEEKDFLSATLPRLRALEKTLEQGDSFETSLKAIPIKNAE